MRIQVSLEALTADFETDFKRASRTAQKEMEALKKQAIAAGKVIGTALVAGAGAFAAIINSNLKTIASYQDLADQVGDTASQISSLKPAADLSETALESVAAASVKLTAGLSKTSDESKGVGKALAAIGIEIEAFRKLAPVAQIDAVAKALNGYKDGAEKTAVAVTLFGKSGAELIPFLKDLGEQTERNVTLTEEQIAAADEYNKTIARMKGEVSSVTQQFAARLAPTMEVIAKRFGEALNESGFLNAALKTLEVTLKTLISAGAVVGSAFNFLGKSLGATAAALVAFAKGEFSEAATILKTAGQDIRTDFADTGRFISDMFAGANKALNETAAATEKADRAAINYSAATEKAEKSIKKQKDALKDFNRELEKYNDLLVSEEDQSLDPARKRGEIRQSVMNPAEKLTARMKELNDPALDLRARDFETYSRAVAQAQEEFASAVDSIGQGMEKIKADSYDVWQEFADMAEFAAGSVTDAFADFLFDPFDKGLKGMLQSFGDTMRRMAAQKTSEFLVNSAINFGMSFFNPAAGLDFGGPIDGPGLRDSGGRGSPGKAYAIGTGAQPELFIPDTAGTFVPKNQWQGGGMTVVQNFTVQAPQGTVSRSTQQNIAASAQRGLTMASKRNN